MSARNKFFYNGTVLTLVGLSVKTVALLFGAFVSRTVGAEGTGLYTLVMTVYSFAVTFATSGVSFTVTRLVVTAIGEDNRGELSRESLLLFCSLPLDLGIYAFGALTTS
jgi:stage V sporulation protein B